MDHAYIGTFTNKKFHFMNPSVEEVCIQDIAQALSMNCRYSGHVKEFYSVAEHCVLIADYVFYLTGCEKEAFCALMHDASEAYLTDIPRPMKPHLTNYKEIEAKAEAVIQEAFSCSPMTKLVKHIDTHICGTEAKQLFHTTPAWCDEYDHIPIVVKCWSPAEARDNFIDRFQTFSPAIGEAA